MRTINSTPNVLHQISDILAVAQCLLLDLDRSKIDADELKHIDRVVSLLSITEVDCDNFAKEIEVSPQYRLGVAS